MKNFILFLFIIGIKFSNSQIPVAGTIRFTDDTEYELPKSLFGVHIGGIFSKASSESDIQPYVWDWISDLQPQIVRFPSGANSKFMHPFDATTGYGYDLCEILNYFDVIEDGNPVPDISCSSLITTWGGGDGIINTNSEINNFFNAVTSSGDLGLLNDEFQKFKTDIANQNSATIRYLDDLIDLINQIKSENTGLDVQVVYCVNILTETDDEVLDIIDFFIDNDVTIAGIEMGNETYSKFFDDVFDDGFSDYYKFIRGQTTGTASKYDELVSAGVIEDNNHNFIGSIRTEYTDDIKIGLVAAPLEDYLFFSPSEDVDSTMFSGGEVLSDWNSQLEDALDDNITIGGIAYPRFDAIIIHPYFTPEYWAQYPRDVFDTDDDGDVDVTFTCPEYDFSDPEDPDSRIGDIYEDGYYPDAFFGAVDGLGEDHEYFSELIGEYYGQFNFFYSENGKELWTTEWNLKDHFSNDDLREYWEIYNNTFLQSYLIFEWFLKQIHITTGHPSYLNFYTISTIHNLLGDSNGNLISRENEDIGDWNSPYDELTGNDKDYILRTPYATYMLLKEITTNNLNYLRCNWGIEDYTPGYHFVNIHTFMNPDGTQLYIYFSNMNPEPVIAEFDLTDFDNTIFPTQYTEFTSACLYALAPSQLYSSAGNNFIYSVNSCYDPEDIDFEIVADNPATNAWYPSNCSFTSYPFTEFELPANSQGYIKIGISDTPLKKANIGETFVSPNPSDGIIHLSADIETSGSEMVVYNLFGEILMHKYLNSDRELNLSELPNGVYYLTINSINYSISEKIIITK